MGGYRIEPWSDRRGTGTDDLDVVVASQKPTWLQVLEIGSMIIPPLYFVIVHFSDKKYEREFWLKNGFDPTLFREEDRRG